VLSSWKKTFIFLAKYFCGYLFFAVIFYFGVSIHKNRNYSQQKLDEMMTTVSPLRDTTKNPCQYSILGDPNSAGEMYLKLNLFCKNGEKSLNSMDLRAIKDKTVWGAVVELGRINGFDKIVIDKNQWVCFQNRKPILSTLENLKNSATLDCFEKMTVEQIEKYYETN
jgi:hypothetical protein